jgi:hypothetical protein
MPASCAADLSVLFKSRLDGPPASPLQRLDARVMHSCNTGE